MRRKGIVDGLDLVWAPSMKGWETFEDIFEELESELAGAAEAAETAAQDAAARALIPVPPGTPKGVSTEEEEELLWDAGRDAWPSAPVVTKVHVPSALHRHKGARPIIELEFDDGPLGLLLGENEKALGGVLVASVEPGGQGEAGGVKPLSVITHVGDVPVTAFSRNKVVAIIDKAARPLTLTLRGPPVEASMGDSMSSSTKLRTVFKLAKTMGSASPPRFPSPPPSPSRPVTSGAA